LSVYTVTQLSAYIKNMFLQDYLLQSVSVKGEVSNCKYHSSGHIYFTLKDPKGNLSCIMFAGNRRGLSFRLEDGQQIVVTGTVDVYELGGKYQLYAKQITLDGIGRLYEKYEALKRELEECGMFAKQYKQPIPKCIHTLGVVTAPTGAAVRDIIQIATRRNPYVQIILYPAIVQGEYAVDSIVTGIQTLEQRGVDLMIVGRGGGSIEDLWAFNERAVAQAIFDCSVPIISAVGHETDTTIADYVADLRAPTPSAAAELAVMDVTEYFETISHYKERLQQKMLFTLRANREKTAYMEKQIALLSPAAKIREKRHLLMTQEQAMQSRMEQILSAKRHTLELAIARLKGLSPLDKISSGYAYLETENQRRVTTILDLEIGERIQMHLKDGTAQAVIEKVQPKEGC